MRNNKYILPMILLIVGISVGFASGYFFKSYKQTQQFSNFRNSGQRGSVGSLSGQKPMGSFGSTEGEVISMDDKSVTVKLPDGSTKIILYSSGTLYSNFLEAKKEDIKQGIKISVFGKSNSDGSLTADRIQLNPANINKTQ